MPNRIVEDVLIKVGDFVFPVDFVVLETQPVSNPKNQIPIILGRPFLATSNALINCRNGSMKLTFGNMTIDLNIFNVGKEPNELYEQPIGVNLVNEIATWSSFEDIKIEFFLEKDVKLNYETNREIHESLQDLNSGELLEELNDICSKWETKSDDVSFELGHIVKGPVGEAPTLDFTLLQSNFSQIFQGEYETHPCDLNHGQDSKVSNLLKQNEEALSWFMVNISGTYHRGMDDCISLEKFVANKTFLRCLGSFSKIHPIPPCGIG